MELRQLEYFVAVARHGNITRAARALFVAQPSLSVQIQALEAEFGTPLLDRWSRGVRLTEAGERFHQRALEILAQAQAAREELQALSGLLSGTLRVATLSSVGASLLPGVIVGFQAAHPGVHLRLRAEQPHEVEACVQRTDVDLGITAAPVETTGLETQILLREEYVLAVQRGHALAARDRLALADLADEPFLLAPHAAWLEACREAEWQPRTVLEGEPHLLLALVAAGVGVAIVPRGMVDREARVAAPVAWVDFEPSLPSRTLVAVWRTGALTAAARAFLQALEAHSQAEASAAVPVAVAT